MGRSRVELVAAIAALTLATVFSVVLPGLVADAQNPAVLKATTRLVVVNVLVHDKKGAPVKGLTRADFTILDEGKEEKIAGFSVETRGKTAFPGPPLPPDTFSNRLARQGDVPTNVAVLLFDRGGMEFSDRAYARQQVIKFLSQLQPHDRVAMCVLGNELWVVQDFTSDPALLLAAIRREQRLSTPVPNTNGSSPGLPIISPMGRTRGNDVAGRFAAGIDFLTRQQIAEENGLAERRLGMGEIAALEIIATHLSGMPGRKSIIWVTGRVPNPNPGQTSPTFAVANYFEQNLTLVPV